MNFAALKGANIAKRKVLSRAKNLRPSTIPDNLIGELSSFAVYLVKKTIFDYPNGVVSRPVMDNWTVTKSELHSEIG